MSLASIIPQNPWSSLTKENIAQCDQPFFAKYGGVANYEKRLILRRLRQSLISHAYRIPFGKVYCFNKNPEEPDRCFVNDIFYEKTTIEFLLMK